MVTHHLADILPEIDRVIMMQDGRIAADGPKDELLDAGKLGALFGTEVQIMDRDGYFDWY